MLADALGGSASGRKFHRARMIVDDRGQSARRLSKTV